MSKTRVIKTNFCTKMEFSVILLKQQGLRTVGVKVKYLLKWLFLCLNSKSYIFSTTTYLKDNVIDYITAISKLV